MGAKEFAVVSFWDLSHGGIFVCNRFFLAPNPTKRVIKQTNGTTLEQMLFISDHTKDVFFFWRGKVQKTSGDDLKSFDS